MSASDRRPRPSLRRQILVRGSVAVLLAVTGLVALLGFSARMRNQLSAAVQAFGEEQLIADRISQAVMRQLVIVTSVLAEGGRQPREESRAAGDEVYDQLRLYLFRDLTTDQRLQLETIQEEHQRLEVAAARTADLFGRGDRQAGTESLEEMTGHAFALLEALGAFVRMREADLQSLRRAQQSAFRAMYVVTGLFGVILLAGAAYVMLFLLGRVDAPLAELTAAARRMEAGDMDVRVREAREEEFASVAASFNRMAERVREREQRLSSIYNTVADVIFQVAVEEEGTYRFTSVNEAFGVVTGIEVERIVGRCVDEVIPEPSLTATLEKYGTAIREKRIVRWEETSTYPTGTLIGEVSVAPVFDEAGECTHLVGAVHDITRRKRMEDEVRALNVELEERVAHRTAALQASEEEFRTLAATAHDAIVAADADGRITYFNPAAERTFGYAAGEVVDHPLTVLMPERFHEPHRAGLARYVATGEAHVVGRTVELAGRRKDGTEVPVELSLGSRRHDGKPAFIGIFRDITERQETEQALQRYATELEAANKELEAFSYSVAHDLRAPLRHIHGFSRAVLEDHGDGLDKQGSQDLRRVCAAAERMGLLIDDLLELSRATRTEIRHRQVDLGPIARRIVAELDAAEPERHVDVDIGEELLAFGDQRLLTLVMRNLMENAWKFTAKRDAATIEVGLTDVEEPAYFVRDNGAGFDATFADKLFQPFHRLHKPRDFPGTGIGLALVQRIVHRHGGRVWAEGAVDRGATFYFTLPAA